MGIRYIDVWTNTQQYYFNFGHVAVLTYFATLIDNNLAKKFYSILGNDCHYKLVYDLPLDGCDDSENAYFDSGDYQDVIQFIDFQLIPALDALNDIDLLDSYGGINGFENLLKSSGGFLSKLLLTSSEGAVAHSSEYLKYQCEEISALLKECVTSNTPFQLDIN